jgi:hypothetical protein
MIENTDKLKPCLICDNTGYKNIVNQDTNKLMEDYCECPWGDISREYLTLFESKNHDHHERCGARRIP